MASIAKDKNGNRRILFVNRDGKRKTIYLGHTPAKIASTIKLRVEQLNSAQIAQTSPDDETLRWLSNVGDDLSKKLVAVGLVASRVLVTLKNFLDDYIESRSDIKDSTATVYGHTRRCLIEFFGADKPLREIHSGDAERWRLWLLNDQKLAENTIRRRSGMAKQFFHVAVRRKLVTENAFAGLVAVLKANPKRYHFITREEAEKVLAACPDEQWRLLFALARYGGLRVPSEPLELRWKDLDWSRGRMLVRSPKTEHHDGGDSRYVPIFPELRPYLEAAWAVNKLGEERVVTKFDDPSVNLRTHLCRIIRRAGLNPWPKLWQNLRSTRETELAEVYPLHVVVKWIGNSQQVAAKHYLQVTDAHFEHAANNPSSGAVINRHASSETTRQTTQQAAAGASKAVPDEPGRGGKRPFFPMNASLYEEVRSELLGDTGFEPVTSTV